MIITIIIIKGCGGAQQPQRGFPFNWQREKECNNMRVDWYSIWKGLLLPLIVESYLVRVIVPFLDDSDDFRRKLNAAVYGLFTLPTAKALRYSSVISLSTVGQVA